MIVENRTGAGNTIAMAAVARAEPDGYTVLANSSTHSLVPVTYGALPFDTFRDLTPIIPLSNTPAGHGRGIVQGLQERRGVRCGREGQARGHELFLRRRG